MNKHLIAATITAASFTLISCAEEPTVAAPPPPPQSIDVAQVLVKKAQNWHTYTTRLTSPEEVSLMPRVSGVIQKITFHEGDKVKKGDLLFKLDNRPFKAVVTSLEAQVKNVKIALDQAEKEAQRSERLIARKAISTEEAEARTSLLNQRAAQLASLKARLTSAQLDLEFTEIRSPIDGIISNANITRGNNVRAGESILTTIVSNKAMYAYFDVDERTWNRSFNNVIAESKQQVVMQKLGQNDYPYSGHVDFINNRINSATGTLRIRAIFKADEQLRSGSFARIKLAANAVSEQIIIPDRAIGTDLKNRFVLTVGEDNVLKYNLVEVGERYGSLRAISSGLTADDIIAVNGPARVGPGMPISPNVVNIDSTNSTFTLQPIDQQLAVTRKEL